MNVPSKDETPEFAEFCESINPDNVVVSRDMVAKNPFKIRIIGPKTGTNTHAVHGLLLHYPGEWKDFDIDEHSDDLTTLVTLAQRAGIRLIWIGEPTREQKAQKTDFKDLSFQSGLIMKSGDGFMTSKMESTNMETMLSRLETFMGITFGKVSHPKEFNEKATDLFHEYVQDQLGFSVIDADAIGRKSPSEPTSIIEVKRSKVLPIHKWYPYKDDLNCYRVQFSLAEATGTVPLVVTQDKPVPKINPRDNVFVFDFTHDHEDTLNSGTPTDELTYFRVRTTAFNAFKHAIGEINLETIPDPEEMVEPIATTKEAETTSFAPSDD